MMKTQVTLSILAVCLLSSLPASGQSTQIIKYGDEQADGKKSLGGSGELIEVEFNKARQVPQTFWVALDFRAHRTKGVYVSYDSSTGGQHSKAGLPGLRATDVDFGGDWMIQVRLAK